MQNFPEAGVPSRKVGMLTYFLPKTAWKWKNLDPQSPLVNNVVSNSESVTTSSDVLPNTRPKEEAFETRIFRIENNQFEPYVHAPRPINSNEEKRC